ncbi:MAG: DUF1963 domain-containing protein [Phycisphaerales bacterium]|nr:DUF1963 domain-containing protein [Phycisphaerales bacterium]
MPPGTAWPTWNDKPLSLVALLDLAELAGMDTGLDLPTVGLLNVFFEADEQMAWGFDPAHANGSRLILADPSNAVSVEPPPGAVHFASFPVAGRRCDSIPSLDEDRLPNQAIDSTQEYTWEFQEALDEAGPHHQVGGWPHYVQGAFWLECQLVSNGFYLGDGTYPLGAAELGEQRILSQEWELLLQLDCDFVAGQEWGDMGRLYFVMRRSDVAEGRFDRAWMVLQCS